MFQKKRLTIKGEGLGGLEILSWPFDKKYKEKFNGAGRWGW